MITFPSLACRVYGCVALAQPAPIGDSDIYRGGLCAVHQKTPVAELRELLTRRWETFVLQPVGGGMEYERADGSQYGFDHHGRYYDVRGLVADGPPSLDAKRDARAGGEDDAAQVASGAILKTIEQAMEQEQ